MACQLENAILVIVAPKFVIVRVCDLATLDQFDPIVFSLPVIPIPNTHAPVMII